MKHGWLAALLGLCVAWPAHAQVELERLIKKSEFEDIKLSPDGRYLAATIPMEDRAGLAVMRRSDSKIVNTFSLGRNNYIGDFFWASPTRLLISPTLKIGMLEQPRVTGELIGLDAEGGHADLLIGFRASNDTTTSRIQTTSQAQVAALQVQPLHGQARSVLVTVVPYGEVEHMTRAEKMDIQTGRRSVVARAPVKGARFFVDPAGAVRFASGSEVDNAQQLFYRDDDQGAWRQVNAETQTHRVETPVGFSADGRTAYLRVERPEGPDVVEAYDTTHGARRTVLADPVSDPSIMIDRFGSSDEPVGAMYLDGRPRTRFIDPAGEEARLYGLLQEAFPDHAVQVTSTTDDGRLALVLAYADRDPGSYYLFDTQTRQASYLLSRRRWIDPKAMARTRPVTLTARDGLPMGGYLTLPQGADPKALPLVVYPHGGPFGIYDTWGFDTDLQVLASAGYAVLQVNYRGSGNRGRSFQQRGAQEWGRTLQDDVTDATRWAIAQGIADPGRICIYGASYGAYAALMGVAREPDLYRCAVGYAGVYDLVDLSADDRRENKRLNHWSSEWLGTGPGLAEVSPDRIAARIKVPVFLAAGGEDQTAPIKHSEKMEASLKAAGVPVETLYYRTEGHGFYTTAHQQAFYTQLLDFLGRNIGSGRPDAQ